MRYGDGVLFLLQLYVTHAPVVSDPCGQESCAWLSISCATGALLSELNLSLCLGGNFTFSFILLLSQVVFSFPVST